MAIEVQAYDPLGESTSPRFWHNLADLRDNPKPAVALRLGNVFKRRGARSPGRPK